jgi:hypothetical protein
LPSGAMATAASLRLPSPSGIPMILKDVRRAGRQIVKQRSRKVVVEMRWARSCSSNAS